MTEIDRIQPRVVIAFGVQVSSILLQRTIKLAQRRTRSASLRTLQQSHTIYPVYYPVGQ